MWVKKITENHDFGLPCALNLNHFFPCEDDKGKKLISWNVLRCSEENKVFLSLSRERPLRKKRSERERETEREDKGEKRERRGNNPEVDTLIKRKKRVHQNKIPVSKL